jgi:hypothetical protein
MAASRFAHLWELEDARSRLFDDRWLRDESIELTVATSIALLLNTWESITQEEILGAWNKIISLW